MTSRIKTNRLSLLLVWALAAIAARPGTAETRDASATMAPVTVEKSFKDWTVTCRDSGYCAAVATGDRGTRLSVSRMARDGGDYAEAPADDPWALHFRFAAPPPEQRRFGLFVDDGLVATLERPTGLAAFGAPETMFLTDEKLLMTLLPRLKTAGSLAALWSESYIIEAGELADGSVERFSLAGLSAALLFIDDTQGRLGSPRIMDMPDWLNRIRAGGTAPSPKMLAAVRAAHAASTECSVRGDDGKPPQPDIHRLDRSNTLFVFSCNHYAYNGDQRAYVVNDDSFEGDGRVEVVAVAVGSRRILASTLIPFADYDPDTMRLSGYYKGRGIGDYGDSYVWRWNGGGFFLVEHSGRDYTPELDTRTDDTVMDWPVVYRYGLDDVSILNPKAAK